MNTIRKKVRDFSVGDVIIVREVEWTIVRITNYGTSEHSFVVTLKRMHEGRKISDVWVLDKLDEARVKVCKPYRVGSFKDAGLKARWTKTRHGRPIIAVWHASHDTWYAISRGDMNVMSEDPEGLSAGFDKFTTLGHIFSVPA